MKSSYLDQPICCIVRLVRYIYIYLVMTFENENGKMTFENVSGEGDLRLSESYIQMNFV